MGKITGVLLIEDDPDVGLLLADILGAAGMDTTLVGHPGDIPADAAPRVVVTDLFGSTGYDRAVATRQLEQLRRRFPGVPLLLVTAHAFAARDRALLPADAVVEKPFDVDALTQLVASYDHQRASLQV